MTFYDFILSLEKQDDPKINEMASLIKNDSNFPKTMEIDVMAKYIYKKLNSELTLAFQKQLMIWLFVENNMQQPDNPLLLNQINLVVELQNNDPEYLN